MDSKQKQTFCMGGRHMSKIYDEVEYAKKILTQTKLLMFKKKNIKLSIDSKVKYLLSKRLKEGLYKNKLCSPMSKSAWCDLSSRGGILKLPDLCPGFKIKRQKQITFSSRQFHLESAGYKIKLQKVIQFTRAARTIFQNRAKTQKLLIGVALAAK